MILAVAVVKGFQREIRNQVAGFAGHFQVVSAQDDSNDETTRMDLREDFMGRLAQMNGIRSFYPYATKPAILESDEGLLGVVAKGVDVSFDWSFLERKIIEGGVLHPDSTGHVLISKFMADRLDLRQGTKVMLYFITDGGDILPRAFYIQGVYYTGMEDYDRKMAFLSLDVLRRVNGWGLQAQILPEDSCDYGLLAIAGLAFGGNGDHRYLWTDPQWEGPGPHWICPEDDREIRLIVVDTYSSAPDTAWLSVSPGSGECRCDGALLTTRTSGGSYRYYAGGIEILLTDGENWALWEEPINETIPFFLQTFSLSDRNPEIFNWLEVLDINAEIIILLMVLVSVINMASALLIIILEKTNMIGLLKAFGATNRDVSRVFLYQAFYILGRGLLAGNLLALGLGLTQAHFQYMKLNPEQYFMDFVPVFISGWDVLWINAGTLVVTFLLLQIPAGYVSRISPVKAIRFD
jgi:lipoprotein-releasing system permease protein